MCVCVCVWGGGEGGGGGGELNVPLISMHQAIYNCTNFQALDQENETKTILHTPCYSSSQTGMVSRETAVC